MNRLVKFKVPEIFCSKCKSNRVDVFTVGNESRNSTDNSIWWFFFEWKLLFLKLYFNDKHFNGYVTWMTSVSSVLEDSLQWKPISLFSFRFNFITTSTDPPLNTMNTSMWWTSTIPFTDLNSLTLPIHIWVVFNFGRMAATEAVEYFWNSRKH